MRNIFILIVLVLYFLLGYKMCVDYNACCTGDETSESTISQEATTTGTVTEEEEICPGTSTCFESGSCTPVYGATFRNMLDSLIREVGEGEKLRIVGLYNSSENNETNFENLGLCRADVIKRLIGSGLPEGRIETGAQLSVGQAEGSGGIGTNLVLFEILKEEVQSLPTGTLIYFPFASTSQIQDPAVEEYLRQLAEQVRATSQRIRLTGHTDDIGSDSDNMRLGRQRAIVIRDYLVSLGVPASRIVVETKGESAPVASNSTERGRAQNRRTELQIIQ